MMRVMLLACALVVALPMTGAWAQDIQFSNIYAYPVAEGGTTGAVFMNIDTQPTESPDQLIHVETPVAGWVEVHATVMEDNVMRMRPIGTLRLAPTGRTELRPGGVHLMLMGMKQPLNGGDSFPMTLLFEKAGTKTITVPVKVMGRVDPADLKDKTTVHDTHNHAH